ncbi:MAG TPA: hypothetical protein VGV89_03080 [Thermoplasmata archaeon]|nr:hypothetical protein [Thermoplasmata archaeon]
MPPIPPAGVLASLRRSAYFGLGMLVVQNALGIYVNLYVPLNDTNSYAGVFPTLFTNAWAAAHVVVGILLFLGALGMVLIGWRTGVRLIRALTLLSLGAIVVAAYSGYHFVLETNNAYSFLMEMGFLVAILSTVGMLQYLSGLDQTVAENIRGSGPGAASAAP